MSNTLVSKPIFNGAEVGTINVDLVYIILDVDADFEGGTLQPEREGHVTNAFPAIFRSLGLDLDERKLANDVDADDGVKIIVVYFLAAVVIANERDAIPVSPQGSRQIEYGRFNGDGVPSCDSLVELQGLSNEQNRAILRLAFAEYLTE